MWLPVPLEVCGFESLVSQLVQDVAHLGYQLFAVFIICMLIALKYKI